MCVGNFAKVTFRFSGSGDKCLCVCLCPRFAVHSKIGPAEGNGRRPWAGIKDKCLVTPIFPIQDCMFHARKILFYLLDVYMCVCVCVVVYGLTSKACLEWMCTRLR